jgi:hypothetical protein
MRAWTTLKKTAAGALAPLLEAVRRPAPRARDPWYYDDERKREINQARADEGAWLGGRQRGWLRQRRHRGGPWL